MSSSSYLTISIIISSQLLLFHLCLAKPTVENKNEEIFKSKYAKLELERFSLTPPNASKIESSAEDSIFTSESDQKIQEEWGGNCTLAYWDRCKVIKVWFSWFKNPKPDATPVWLQYELDCKIEPVLCMKNGWSVTRCHILCMGQCNKEMLTKFDKYVSHENECKAHAHG